MNYIKVGKSIKVDLNYKSWKLIFFITAPKLKTTLQPNFTSVDTKIKK